MATAKPELVTSSHAEIELLAYRYWQERGCLEGEALDDWLRAEQEIERRRLAPHSSNEPDFPGEGEYD